jgi:acyl-coenzyme A synthetase/AMP-(fatty) acid ligase
MPNMTDYDAERAAFHLEVPAFFNATRDIVDARASSAPDRDALVMVAPDGRTADTYTFAQLRARTCRAANVLAGLGVTKGDRVLVMLPRVIAWYDVVLAVIRLGAIPMPATAQLTSKDLAYRIGRAEASVAITDADGMARVDAIHADCPSLRLRVLADGAAERTHDPADGWVDLSTAMAGAPAVEPEVEATRSDDPMLIYFTSGTTGAPKMVLHTHASYGIGHQITARYWQDLRPGDIFWGVADTGWAKAAWSKLFGQWGVGATVLAWNAKGKPDFDQMLQMIVDHGVTVFCAPPTIYRNFVLRDLDGYDFSSLRHCLAAGEALNPETFTAWREATGTQIHDGYGQTETVNLLANYPCMPIKPGSLGKPTPGLEVAIVDDRAAPLPTGSEGQIAVRVKPERPPWLFTEYWRDEEATARSHQGDYYLTGDRAYVDEDGYFWFRSRNDDVIISSGYRIGPFEVESVLMEHGAVAETAVIGVPDDMRGQAVKAFVVLAPGHQPSPELARELQQFVQEQTAPYKYPRHLEFIDELPKTTSGKIRRVELRALPT